jgi:hypothetical protein
METRGWRSGTPGSTTPNWPRRWPCWSPWAAKSSSPTRPRQNPYPPGGRPRTGHLDRRRRSRHVHRSRWDCYDGYQLYLAVDAHSDLLTAAAAATASTHDAKTRPKLLAADPVAVAEVLADIHCLRIAVRRNGRAQVLGRLGLIGS